MSLIDISKEEFVKFQNEFESLKANDLSESDTRCKVLDKIFINILGWQENDIRREEFSESGYYDYKISTAGFQFILEAKRNFQNLVLPDSGNKFKLKTLINKGNIEVIKQIRNYIIDHGLTYGVVSNGHQFIIARFVNQDGTDWQDNDSYVFRSLEDIHSDFITFFNLLSKESVIKNGKIKFFQDLPRGKTLLEVANPMNKDEVLVRNELSTMLIQVATDVFEDIYDLEDANVLKECYVENKDVEKQNSELDILFPDDPPTFDEKIQRLRNTANTRDKIKDEIFKSVTSVPNPIIIIGSKGAGKTTFIKYFVEVTLNEERRTHKVPVVYIDFKNYTYQQIQNTEAIYNEIISTVQSKYPQYELLSIESLKKIYNNEIEQNLSGIWSYAKGKEDLIEQKIAEYLELQLHDKINHLRKVASYLESEFKVRLCVVLDNADQLDDKSQEEVFLLSQSIKVAIKSLVILSLREGYYFQWKNRPPFDAYPSVVYHITAPPYNDILRKRMEYILNHYDFNKVRGVYQGNVTVELGHEKIKKFFESLSNTFFNTRNDEILRFLGETSYPDIRSLLQKIRLFLISGYTKISTYIAMDFDTIPIWDFIKAIALDSRYYYKSSYSIIYNLFYPARGNTNHFTKIRILKYLLDVIISKPDENYRDLKNICETFSLAGYGKEVLVNELSELLRYGLIETPNSLSDTPDLKINDDSKFKITLSGKYYICDLVSRSIYLDLIAQDTPIYDDQLLKEMGNIFPVAERDSGYRDMSRRIKVINKFIEYLDKQEKSDLSRSGDGGNVSALDYSVINQINGVQLKRDLGLMARNLNPLHSTRHITSSVTKQL